MRLIASDIIFSFRPTHGSCEDQTAVSIPGSWYTAAGALARSYRGEAPSPMLAHTRTGGQSGIRGMAVLLVVGATGQLGRAIVWRLRADGVPVRALVRPTSNMTVLLGSDAELVKGDL